MFTNPWNSQIPYLISQTIQWIEQNINSQIKSKYGQGITAVIDNVLAVGHSAGCKIVHKIYFFSSINNNRS
jgi:hypothetical protein